MSASPIDGPRGPSNLPPPPPPPEETEPTRESRSESPRSEAQETSVSRELTREQEKVTRANLEEKLQGKGGAVREFA